MKRLLFLLLFPAVAFAQTFTVSGHVVDPSTAVPSLTTVTFKLVNTGTQQCKVSGTGLIVPNTKSFTPDGSGVISGTLYRNDFITCGTQTNSQWAYTITSPSVTMPTCVLAQVKTGSLNLDSTACSNTSPVVTPPTGDNTYCRLDGSNCGFTGNITFNSNNATGIGNVGATSATLTSATLTGALTVGSAANSSGSITSNDLGVFTNTQENEYLQSLLNSCVPGTEWTNIGQSGFTTNAISGCNAVPAAATAVQAAGVAGWVNNLSTTTNAVGVYGQARALATGAHTWGGNDITSDAGFAAVMQGHEVDCNISNSGSTGQCLDINGNFSAQPAGNTFPAIRIFKPGANQFTAGIDFKDGSVVAGSAINIAVTTTGNNQFSQTIGFTGRDSGGTTHVASIAASPNGDFRVNSTTGVSQFLAASGALSIVEAAAPSGSATTDIIYAKSASHRWMMNNNNAGEDTVLGAATTDTLTNKTFTGATTGNNLSVLNAQGAVGAITGDATDHVVYTYSLPANTIDTTSKALKVRCGLVHSSGTANPTVKIFVNGVAALSGAIGTSASQSVSLEAQILRTASTTGGSWGLTTSAGNILPFTAGLTGLAWTTSQTVTCTFNVANTDQMSGVMFMVEQIQ